MQLKIYQVDAFTNKVFEGNPAAIIPLDSWLNDREMQKIARENNLSETAFFVKEGEEYHLRWFTPVSEVDMCGHATLASAYILFEVLEHPLNEITFNSKSGLLKVIKKDDAYTMNFPIQDIQPCNVPQKLLDAFETTPLVCFSGMDYILVFETENEVLHTQPNLELLNEIDLRGVIVTSKSKMYDFVTRFFAPKYGIDEDPVTGSAFTQLVPMWNTLLEKKSFHAKQVSARGGEVFCELQDKRVMISGQAVKYLEGYIEF
jgi:PhzF family phenazine biosynthesis protein